MSRVYKSPTLVLNAGAYSWVQPKDFWTHFPASWLCAKTLSQLAYVDGDKPLRVCVSKKKPDHKNYLQYSISHNEYMKFHNFPGLKRREIYGRFHRWLSISLWEGYIWLEQ